MHEELDCIGVHNIPFVVAGRIRGDVVHRLSGKGNALSDLLASRRVNMGLASPEQIDLMDATERGLKTISIGPKVSTWSGQIAEQHSSLPAEQRSIACFRSSGYKRAPFGSSPLPVRVQWTISAFLR